MGERERKKERERERKREREKRGEREGEGKRERENTIYWQIDSAWKFHLKKGVKNKYAEAA
jgi:hypothetical protein